MSIRPIAELTEKLSSDNQRLSRLVDRLMENRRRVPSDEIVTPTSPLTDHQRQVRSEVLDMIRRSRRTAAVRNQH